MYHSHSGLIPFVAESKATCAMRSDMAALAALVAPCARFGAALLGYWFRRLVDIGADPLRALAIAKRRVGIGPGQAKDDTLQFRAYYRKV